MTNVKWFVAGLKPGGFSRARTNLARQGFETFMPVREVRSLRRGGNKSEAQPLFPGYIFVKFDPDKTQWRSINNTFGVTGLIMSRLNVPQHVPGQFMNALIHKCDAHGQIFPSENITIGHIVRVVDGPFIDLIARVESLPKQGRVALLLELLGRATRVEFSPKSLELATAG
ncbi:MAG: transcriptional activator RfaH [Rhodobacteraceae bacterium]|nr:transcriptional activator RfaH [Paracoccaceae bacterium]